MRQPGTAAGPKGKHRIKFPIHPFHAGKAKQRRQRKRPRLRIGKRQGKPLRFRPVQRPPPASRPGQQGFPHSPGRRLLPVPALRGMRTAGRARGKGQLRPGACWRPGPLPPQLVQREGAPQLQSAVLRQEGAQQGPASRPAEVTFIEPLSETCFSYSLSRCREVCTGSDFHFCSDRRRRKNYLTRFSSLNPLGCI